MKRLATVLILAAMPVLGGCVPMMAASAVGTVAQAATPAPVSNAALAPDARGACTQMAAQYGTVDVIDVEQHRVNEIIVWGTVQDAKQKRSFECDFGTKIRAFKLRQIHPEN